MNRGIFGRRKSDWVLPIGLALLVGLALGWAVDSRAKSEEIASLKVALKSALNLSEAPGP